MFQNIIDTLANLVDNYRGYMAPDVFLVVSGDNVFGLKGGEEKDRISLLSLGSALMIKVQGGANNQVSTLVIREDGENAVIINWDSSMPTKAAKNINMTNVPLFFDSFFDYCARNQINHPVLFEMRRLLTTVNEEIRSVLKAAGEYLNVVGVDVDLGPHRDSENHELSFKHFDERVNITIARYFGDNKIKINYVAGVEEHPDEMSANYKTVVISVKPGGNISVDIARGIQCGLSQLSEFNLPSMLLHGELGKDNTIEPDGSDDCSSNDTNVRHGLLDELYVNVHDKCDTSSIGVAWVNRDDGDYSLCIHDHCVNNIFITIRHVDDNLSVVYTSPITQQSQLLIIPNITSTEKGVVVCNLTKGTYHNDIVFKEINANTFVDELVTLFKVDECSPLKQLANLLKEKPVEVESGGSSKRGYHQSPNRLLRELSVARDKESGKDWLLLGLPIGNPVPVSEEMLEVCVLAIHPDFPEKPNCVFLTIKQNYGGITVLYSEDEKNQQLITILSNQPAIYGRAMVTQVVTAHSVQFKTDPVVSLASLVDIMKKGLERTPDSLLTKFIDVVLS